MLRGVVKGPGIFNLLGFLRKKIRRTERFYFVIRFEILYKEADVDCFKHPDGAEEWGCFLTLRQIEGHVKRLWLKPTL